MKNKRIISLALCGMMLFGLAGCNNDPVVINPNGEVEDTSTPPPADTTVQMPVYDYKNLPQGDELPSSIKETETSYYARQLSTNNFLCYTEIYNEAQLFSSEIMLTKPVSPDALKQVMNIIFLDTPELFMLEPAYSYETDSNGNVAKIFLKYNMTREEYENETSSSSAQGKVLFIDQTTQNISYFKSQQDVYTAEQTIVETVQSDRYTNDYLYGEKEKVHVMNFYDTLYSRTSNVLTAAKAFSYYCRQTGIDAAVVVGELTTTDFAKEIGLNLGEYKTPEKAFTETVDGTRVNVTVDYSGFYFWNIVKLNGDWYHVDTVLPMLYATSSDILRGDIMKYSSTLINVDDLTISQSRLFYINEQILGLLPECNSKIFQSYYRSGKYFLDYNANQLVIAVNNMLDDIVSQSGYGMSTVMYQFGSEDTYNLFIQNFDKYVEAYNENNRNVFQNYKLTENRETLSIIISDIILER